MHEINVLFVDDEEFTLNSLNRLLRKETYTTFFAESGAEAIEIVDANDIHIIVSDMKMPEMDGLTLLRKIKDSHPNIVRLVLSAYTQTAQLLPCINSGEIFRFITKPLEKEELKRAINDAIEMHLVQSENKQLVASLQDCNKQLQLTLKKKNDLEARLEMLCGVDEVTSLYNQRQLYASLEQELSRHHRYGSTFSAMLLRLDMSDHIVGEQNKEFKNHLLIEFTALLRSATRKVDLSFRYDENSFFIILPETSLADANDTLHRLVEQYHAQPSKFQGIACCQSLIAGIVSVSQFSDLDPEGFLALIESRLRPVKGMELNGVAES